MVEFNKNIWAPWRMEYIDQLHEENDNCFICTARDNPDKDEQNHVIKRGKSCFVLMNRFPYTSGHLLVAPYQHVGDLTDLDDSTLLELMTLTRDMKALLEKVVRAEGLNIGVNFGRCAGAGLPGHLHLHIVPRWSGDTNFMPVLGEVRVIPDSLDALYRKLIDGLA